MTWEDEPGSYELGEREPTLGELDEARIMPRITLPVINEEEKANQVIRVLARHPNLFQRHGSLVRITRDLEHPAFLREISGMPVVRELSAHSLREMISSHFVFLKKGKFGQDVVSTCPDWLKNAIKDRGEWEAVRPISGVVTWPAMRTDGSFVTRPGYDAGTGLYYIGPEVSYPECPGVNEATEAAEFLLEPVAEFPFQNDAHRSAWFALPLTLMVRYAIDCTPVWIFDAPTPGTGKTLLAELAVRMVTGANLPRMAPSDDPEEDRKRITSMAVNGETVCLIDNVVSSFGNAAFDAAVTSEEWTDRVLGQNRTVRVPLRIVWLVSGNNVLIKGDMQRRVMHCRIDPQLERPEERTFKRTQGELVEMVSEQRPEYLRAMMTVLRHALAADPPKMAHWGSFELWSRYVRRAAVLCGLVDPIETRDSFRRSADTAHEARVTFLSALYKITLLTDEQKFTTKRMLGLVQSDDDAREAAAELAKCQPKDLTSQRLGYVMRALRGRVASGFAIRSESNRENSQVWWVERVNPL